MHFEVMANRGRYPSTSIALFTEENQKISSGAECRLTSRTDQKWNFTSFVVSEQLTWSYPWTGLNPTSNELWIHEHENGMTGGKSETVFNVVNNSGC